MSIHFDPAFDAMTLCEWKLRLALKRGYLAPEPGAPWGAGLARPGRPGGKSYARNIERVTHALQKHGPMTYHQIAKRAGMADSTAAKTLTQMVKDGLVGFQTEIANSVGNRTYKRRVCEVHHGSV